MDLGIGLDWVLLFLYLTAIYYDTLKFIEISVLVNCTTIFSYILTKLALGCVRSKTTLIQLSLYSICT